MRNVKVANVRNMSRTMAIEVCLPFNLSGIFDFMYLRFCHSKGKSIADVCMNSRNEAVRSMVFFSLFLTRNTVCKLLNSNSGPYCLLTQVAGLHQYRISAQAKTFHLK
jgi:hypothetical protein